MIRIAIMFVVGVAFVLACLVAVTHGQEFRDTIFQGPGFTLDLTRWAPFYVEDGVYLCILEDGKWTAAAVAPGSVILIPVRSPADSTEVK